MSFTPEQKALLAAPLDKANVKSRDQGGAKLSYIEAWWAIAEANRVFGFDGWDRQTVDLKLLGEPREVNGKMRVGYMARVRITVRAGETVVTREGCGFGSGIDKDTDQAHESALKEAESDAMKRALMTFGNLFGLALYDKTQANVASAPAVDYAGQAGAMKAALSICATEPEAAKWRADNEARIHAMPSDLADDLVTAYKAHVRSLREAA